MAKSVPRNAPCPCGSGKKYKHCCLHRDRKRKPASTISASFTTADGSQVDRDITSLDSIPTHNANGLEPDVSKEEMLQLVLDEMVKELEEREVESLLDLTNDIVEQMNIVPAFTYRDIGKAIDAEDRLDHHMMQVVCLAGNDPIELFAEKMA